MKTYEPLLLVSKEGIDDGSITHVRNMQVDHTQATRLENARFITEMFSAIGLANYATGPAFERDTSSFKLPGATEDEYGFYVRTEALVEFLDGITAEGFDGDYWVEEAERSNQLSR